MGNELAMMGNAVVGSGQFRCRCWLVAVAKVGKWLAFCTELPPYPVRGMLGHPDDVRGVRMRSSSRLTQNQAALLSALTTELKASASSAAVAIDRTIAELDELDRRMPEIEVAARERASIEFSDLDPQRFAQLLGRPAKT